MKTWLSASLAAILIQLPLFAILGLLPMAVTGGLDSDELGFYVSAVLIVSVATLVLVGLPVFALLLRRERVNAQAIALTGLCIGLLPVAVLGWPYHGLYGRYSSSSVMFGHVVDYYRSGSPTMYAWLDYLLCMVRTGLQGMLGALAFYWVWQRQE